MIERFIGTLSRNGVTIECVVTPNPRGGWYLEAPPNLAPGDYALTFGDRNEKNRMGIFKRAKARRDRIGQWTVEDVTDA